MEHGISSQTGGGQEAWTWVVGCICVCPSCVLLMCFQIHVSPVLLTTLFLVPAMSASHAGPNQLVSLQLPAPSCTSPWTYPMNEPF